MIKLFKRWIFNYLMIIKLEYIWIDGFYKLRSKTKILNTLNNDISVTECPIWNYDGSSTNQASTINSEVIIKPCVLYNDPFRGEPHKLVLCDTYTLDHYPHKTNKRYDAMKIFEKYKDLEPLYGLEQEFFIIKDGYPIGFPKNRIYHPLPQSNYYCGIGGDNAFGRNFIEKAFSNCLNAGLKLTGLNAEVAPSQWEFQLCCKGIDAADQLYIMRYILVRTAEEYGWSIDFSPKPIEGDWNGSGCHTNFSTKPMRDENGYTVILDAINKLSLHHNNHMKLYGEGNEKRMTGDHETADYNKFTFGVANRGCSIRIPKQTEINNKGYFEDRRPASNMDPYIVTSLLLDTTS